MSKKELIRKLKFTLFSISSGLIEIGMFALLNSVLHFPYWLSYLLALIASVIWNFTLNREFTFKSSGNIPIAMLKVGIFYLIFTPLSTIIGNYLVESLKWNEYVVTGINMLSNFILEYLYDEFYVFRGTIDTKIRKDDLNEKN